MVRGRVPGRSLVEYRVAAEMKRRCNDCQRLLKGIQGLFDDDRTTIYTKAKLGASVCINVHGEYKSDTVCKL